MKHAIKPPCYFIAVRTDNHCKDETSEKYFAFKM